MKGYWNLQDGDILRLMIGKNLNFMNILFINLFMVQIITGGFVIHNFFIIGEENWNDNEPEPEKLMGPCGLW